MEAQELTELGEKMRGSEKTVGLTMAVIAALLATVTLVGHRLHTEEIVLQTRAVDGWDYYQAKDSRSHMYEADAQLAQLIGPRGADTASAWQKRGDDERTQAEDIRKENVKLDEETQAAARRAAFFDGAEICLEVAIVLCSITLLTGSPLFWRLSFAGTALGLVLVLVGVLRG
jgi:Domain of unknown function (DUF4337)